MPTREEVHADSGAKVLVADKGRLDRIAGMLDASVTSRRSTWSTPIPPTTAIPA